MYFIYFFNVLFTFLSSENSEFINTLHEILIFIKFFVCKICNVIFAVKNKIVRLVAWYCLYNHFILFNFFFCCIFFFLSNCVFEYWLLKVPPPLFKKSLNKSYMKKTKTWLLNSRHQIFPQQIVFQQLGIREPIWTQPQQFFFFFFFSF